MKRSEMVKLLYEAINSHMDVKMDYHVSIAAIKSGLNSIEKAGMLPPNQYACTNEFRFEWEPEDD